VQQLVRVRQIGQLLRQTPFVAAGSLINALLVVVVFWDRAALVYLLAWLAVVCLLNAWSVHVWWRNRHRAAPSSIRPHTLRKAAITALLAGVLWGGLGLTLYQPDSPAHQIFLVFVLGGMASASGAAHAPLPAAFRCFVLPCMLPLILRLAWHADPVHVAEAGMLGFYLISILFFARNGYRSFVEHVRMGLEKAALVSALEKSQQTLESRVETRTAALAAANARLQDEVAERMAAEEALRWSQQEYQLAMAAAHELMWSWDAESNLIQTPQGWRKLGFGKNRTAIRLDEWKSHIHPDDVDRYWDCLIGYLRGARPAFEVEYRVRHNDGHHLWVHDRGTALRGSEGRVYRMVGSVADITDRKRAEELNTRLGRIIEESINEIYIFDSNNLRFRQVNRGARENLGYSMEELYDLTPLDLMRRFTPESFAERIRPLRDGSTEKLVFDTVLQRKNGTCYDAEVHLQLASSESPPVFIAFLVDITERKATEQQLRHAHRMEAVGQLTGGVAHDFNNLLTVVLGNLELLRDDMPDDSRNLRMAEAAIRAVERGAELTQRLLAFSRKQALQPKPINLNTLVADMSELLRRALGETIEIELSPSRGLWPTLADPAQLENALLNLAINARDAMANGGRLTLTTANVDLSAVGATELAAEPGPYVMLAVTDTGAGMTPEILERVFEPFFTTKDVGKGSGLGLSMVYGFVRQSGGYVDVESQPDAGTTVRLYLPRANSATMQADGDRRAAPGQEGHGEAVMVLEGDATVRELVVGMLSQLGYRTVTPESGESALAVLERNSDIAVLFTDTSLPHGTDGVEIARAVQRLRPGLRIVFTSRHERPVISDLNRTDETVGFIQKPYQEAELAERLSQLLSG